MAQNTARKLPATNPVAYKAPDDDWQPLHPLHRRLVEEYSRGNVVHAKPRFGARLAMIAALALASWAIVGVIVRYATGAF